MAREGRWGRGRAARPEAGGTGENSEDVQQADRAATTYAAREQRAADRRAAREPEPEQTPEPEPTPEPAAEQTKVLEPEPEPTAAVAIREDPEEPEPDTERDGFRLGDLTPLLLLRAAHPRQAVLTAVGVAVAAALAGRPSREILLVLCTVLVGQIALGWFNDLVDRQRDARHDRTGKPVADGRLDPGTLWFCLALAVFLVVPLSVGNGTYAGAAYLGSLLVAALGGQWLRLRRGFLSWLPWAASYALYPAFLSYGGWGGQEHGGPPELAITGLAALLGIGVHFLTALWGLVPDNADGWTYLPLRLGLRIGASRLLWVAGTWTVLVLVGLAFAGTRVGLVQHPL